MRDRDEIERMMGEKRMEEEGNEAMKSRRGKQETAERTSLVIKAGLAGCTLVTVIGSGQSGRWIRTPFLVARKTASRQAGRRQAGGRQITRDLADMTDTGRVGIPTTGYLLVL